MKQLDLFEKEEVEEPPLTLMQAIKNDLVQPIILTVAMTIFVAGAFLT